MITDWATITTIIPFVLLFIVPANRKPSTATAWLLLAFLLPYIGVLLFLLLAIPKPSKSRRTAQPTMVDLFGNAVVEARHRPQKPSLLLPPISTRYEPLL